MATKLEKLFFAIGMRDEASGKLGKLQQSIDRTCRQVRNNFEGIKSGALTAVGTGMTLYQMVTPAVDFNRAVGEVSSLGVADEALEDLQGQAKNFAMQYGGNAAAIIRASYDIQSAIAGLEGKELGTFTVASATLAKATKADAATITSYMGTMYGIFKQQADSMGRGQWVEQLSGRTAMAVQMFKTTGMEMSSAFTALGANATAAGIKAEEQMAVLGMLQSTMGGSEAGTKYKAFLAGVGNAQKELGLKFTDKSGNMLGVEAILAKLRGKFGDTLDVKESDQLKKAFGSDEAVSMIKLLLGDTKALSQNIDALGKVQGMDRAKEMAGKMTDVWDRAGASINILAVTFSQKLLPSIEPVVGKLVGFIGYLVQCMDIAPALTGKIGLIVTAAILLGGVMGLLGMLVAINKMAFLGLQTVFGPLIGSAKLLALGMGKVAAALWANPVLLVVGGLVLLGLAVAGLILYWDEFKAAFGDTWWGSAIITAVQSICQWWETLTSALSDGRWGDALMAMLDALLLPLKALGNGIGWVGEKLGLASGPTVDFMGHETETAVGSVPVSPAQPLSFASPKMQALMPSMPGVLSARSEAALLPPQPASFSAPAPRIAPQSIAPLEAPRTLSLDLSGLGSLLRGMGKGGKSTSIGEVNIYPQTQTTPEEISEQALLW